MKSVREQLIGARSAPTTPGPMDEMDLWKCFAPVYPLEVVDIQLLLKGQLRWKFST